jgi:hypothetical protein
MAGVFGILLTAAAIALLEVPAMLKHRRRDELVVFGLLLAAAAGLSVGEALKLPVPNPAEWLTLLFKPVTEWVLARL